MRVALVCDWFLPRQGGVELQLLDLASELRERGHEPVLVTSTAGPRIVEGLRVHRLRDFAPPGWGTFRDGLERRNGAQLPAFPWPWHVGRLERLFARERVDAVHGHSLYSTLALLAMTAAFYLRIPTVLTNHSLLRGPGATYLRTIGYPIRWWKFPATITGVSRIAAADASAAAQGRSAHVVPNGIRVADWRVPARRASEAVRVVSVMRLNRRKRPHDLVRAMPRVLAAAPRTRLAIVGDGPLRSMLEREARALGVGNAVSFLGRVPRSGVRRILAEADVFALPSAEEAFGIAVLEARCAGLPVVARGASGVEDLVADGREGLLARDPDEFAQALSRVVADEPLRLRLGHRAPEGLERFDWSVVAERYVALYRGSAMPAAT